jgi:hypothetical protein
LELDVNPTYDRPVKATLHVHLENGESWPVTRHSAYMTFDETLGELLMQAGLISNDITEARLNPVRYLVETTIAHPDLIDHPDHDGWASVVEIERALQASPVLPSGGQQ